MAIQLHRIPHSETTNLRNLDSSNSRPIQRWNASPFRVPSLSYTRFSKRVAMRYSATNIRSACYNTWRFRMTPVVFPQPRRIIPSARIVSFLIMGWLVAMALHLAQGRKPSGDIRLSSWRKHCFAGSVLLSPALGSY